MGIVRSLREHMELRQTQPDDVDNSANDGLGSNKLIEASCMQLSLGPCPLANVAELGNPVTTAIRSCGCCRTRTMCWNADIDRKHDAVRGSRRYCFVDLSLSRARYYSTRSGTTCLCRRRNAFQPVENFEMVQAKRCR